MAKRKYKYKIGQEVVVTNFPPEETMRYGSFRAQQEEDDDYVYIYDSDRRRFENQAVTILSKRNGLYNIKHKIGYTFKFPEKMLSSDSIDEVTFWSKACMM